MNRKLTLRAPSSAARRSPAPEAPDPFRFGWRYVGDQMVALTPDDVLHPREGDQIPENTIQEHDRRYLACALDYLLADEPHIAVLSDCLVNWGVKGLRNHSPDVSVFDGVANRSKNFKTFYVLREGARPLLAVEIVSLDRWDPRLRANDVEIKFREYHRAGVPLYVIVDQEEEDGPRKLLGYRRGRRKYVRIPLDDQDRLLLKPVNLLLGLRDKRLVAFNATTGEEIGDVKSQAQSRQVAEAALAAAQARIRELEAEVLRHQRGQAPRSRNHQ